MKASELISNYPRLWHMAEDASWDSIRKRGLLSTSALLDLYDVGGEFRRSLESQRRPHSVIIERDGLRPALIRDQKPMQEKKLSNCLRDGLRPEDWYRMLNARVYFWASLDRLKGLFDAEAYHGRPHTILTIDTRSLVEAHRERIELSPINSGATYHKPAKRGLDTFLPINDYPFEERPKKSRKRAIAEVVALGSVPDIRDHVIEVCRVDGGERVQIYLRESIREGESLFEWS